jgi:transposase-like protein
MERRKFTREFKLEAVKLIRDRGVSYAQASQDLRVHPTQLQLGESVCGRPAACHFPDKVR